jgi:hypothetical protein
MVVSIEVNVPAIVVDVGTVINAAPMSSAPHVIFLAPTLL